MSLNRFAALSLALFAGALAGSPAGAEDIFQSLFGGAKPQFFWSKPEPAPEPKAISNAQVREVLRREGARLIGAPRRRGDEIVARGKDASGAERKFTLDAETGEVLQIAALAPAPEHARPKIEESVAPGEPLGGPVHPGDGLEPVAPPAAPAAKAAPAKAAAVPAEPAPEGDKPADPDAALSPIKPLRGAGAPKVEKLPQ